MILFFIILLALNFSPFDLHAKSIDANFNYKKTSDNIYFRTQDIKYLTYRSDLTYPYAEEKEMGSGYSVEGRHGRGSSPTDFFSISLIKLRYIYKKNENFNWSAAVGAHHLKNEEPGAASATLMNIDLNSQWQFLNNQFLQFQYAHDWKYSDLSLPGSLDQFLKSDRFDLFFFLRPKNRLRVIAPVVVEEISDNNRKFQFNPQILYGIFSSSPWLWVGFGSEYLSNSDPGVGYWSPSRFIAFGPRVEYATAIGSSHWSLISGFALNKIKEEDSPSGSGYSWSLGIQKGVRSETHVGVSCYKISSEQAGSRWNETGSRLNIFYIF